MENNVHEYVGGTSEQYRQDHYAGFIKENIKVDPTGLIKEMELYETFKEWWKLQYGYGMPKRKQLFDYITNNFDAKKGRSWKGIS